MNINADLSMRAQLFVPDLPWRDSPLPGVTRRMLERDGEETARATTVVRYAPQSRFDSHSHDLGEEILVLDGTFSDQSGDFPAGMYLRNPPGSSHQPHSEDGCTILVKLRQFDPADDQYLRINCHDSPWQATDQPGLELLPLFARNSEQVALQRWAAGTRLDLHSHPGGEEIYVLEGEIEDEHGCYPSGTWLRQPAGSTHAPHSESGCTVYIKTGHLPTAISQ